MDNKKKKNYDLQKQLDPEKRYERKTSILLIVFELFADTNSKAKKKKKEQKN